MVADHQSSKHQDRINAWVNVRLGSEADILRSPDHVRFTSNSGHRRDGLLVRSMPGGNIATSPTMRARGPMSIARAHSARRVQTTTTEALAVF